MILEFIIASVVVAVEMTWNVGGTSPSNIMTKPALESQGCGQRNFLRSSADSESFPWMVEIMERKGRALIRLCRGSLIHSRVILTTAHCVAKFEQSPQQLSVRISERISQQKFEGLIDGQPEQDQNVLELIVHEDFHQSSRHNDFALLVLSKNVSSSGIICLPDAKAIFDGHRCFICRDGESSSGQMTRVELPVVTHDNCQESLRKTYLGRNFELDHSLVCAGSQDGVNSCRFDRGSPLFCPILGKPNRYVQIGIAANRFGCSKRGSKKVYKVYGNIASARYWIDEQMRNIFPRPDYPYVAK